MGVSSDKLATLPRATYRQARQRGMCVEDKCTVCQEQYEPSDVLLQLPCKHWFHSDCIAQWLRASKMCPVCMGEVEDDTGACEGAKIALACPQDRAS